MTKKMAIPKSTLPGTETDGKGNYIPLQERTEDDQAKVADVIAHAVAPDDTSDKNPNGELQNPAPISDGSIPEEGRGNSKRHSHDLQGHQGGQRGGNREP